MIKYHSTNRRVPLATLREALLQGQAADYGLFMPEKIPTLTRDNFAALKNCSYAEIAHAILSPYCEGTFEDERLMGLCQDAYNFEIPLEKVIGRQYVMRLDRGPTASFKDFAARMMARWMGVLLEQDNTRLVILTATSGDTGSAVAHAYHGVDRIQIVVLFPTDEVSTRQRKQMTTLGGNVMTFGVDGKFDDCQALVKRAFADPELSSVRLSSANSINIGRLLPQAVFYVYAYARLADAAQGEPIIFSIPSGNFGDMMGAIIARQMGLPVQRLVIATNDNDEVPKFVSSGSYEKIVPSRVCLSNAMNVGHPSNLARLVEIYGGQMDEKGQMAKKPDMTAMRRDLYAISISDEQTRATIKEAYQQHQLVLEPHGAVGWAGLKRYLADEPASKNTLAVSVETAHPAKFPDEIISLIGLDPEVPPSLAGIEQRPEQFEKMTVAYEPFRDLLKQRFGNSKK